MHPTVYGAEIVHAEIYATGLRSQPGTGAGHVTHLSGDTDETVETVGTDVVPRGVQSTTTNVVDVSQWMVIDPVCSVSRTNAASTYRGSDADMTLARGSESRAGFKGMHGGREETRTHVDLIPFPHSDCFYYRVAGLGWEDRANRKHTGTNGRTNGTSQELFETTCARWRRSIEPSRNPILLRYIVVLRGSLGVRRGKARSAGIRA